MSAPLPTDEAKILTEDEVREIFARECAAAGGLLAYARAHRLCAPQPGLFLRRARRLTYSIEQAMGLERVWRRKNG